MPKIVGIECENGEQTAVYVETADGVKKFVAERKRGGWVDISCVVHDPDGDWIATQYQCSLCGRKEYMKEPFCNCGADMREVDHETD